eukprot:11166687-Lingulodinium_polyedra.AAC.1
MQAAASCEPQGRPHDAGGQGAIATSALARLDRRPRWGVLVCRRRPCGCCASGRRHSRAACGAGALLARRRARAQ